MTIPSRNSGNPAQFSKVLTPLFPPEVRVTELRLPGDPALLMHAEALCLGGSVGKRRQEFAAGRLCARRAMAAFEIHDFQLLVAADRQPLWPQTLVGSITHTQGLCAAALASRLSLAAIGMDCEVVGHVKPELWNTICLEQELSWVLSLPYAEQEAAVSLIFSAKEAFYKCQFPLTSEWLDFHDLYIAASRWGGTRESAPAEFVVTLMRRVKIGELKTLPVIGRYLFHDQFIATGVVLPS